MNFFDIYEIDFITDRRKKKGGIADGNKNQLRFYQRKGFVLMPEF